MNTTQVERLKELREVAELAHNEKRFDIVEQVYLDMQELEAQANIVELTNLYVQTTPADQILSNQINNLIHYFGREKVKDMVKLIFHKVG